MCVASAATEVIVTSNVPSTLTHFLKKTQSTDIQGVKGCITYKVFLET